MYKMYNPPPLILQENLYAEKPILQNEISLSNLRNKVRLNFHLMLLYAKS